MLSTKNDVLIPLYFYNDGRSQHADIVMHIKVRLLVRPVITISSCADLFCQRVSNFDNVFLLVDEGKVIKIPLLVGHHRHTSETPFKWRFSGLPMMPYIECWLGNFVTLMGSGPVLLRNPIFL